MSLLQDVETGQRGYLLTRKKSYLLPYREAIGQIEPSLEKLHSFFSGDPNGLGSLNAFSKSIRTKVADVSLTIELTQAGKSAQALALMNTDQGRNEMTEIRKWHQQFKFAQAERILAQSEQVEKIIERSNLLTLIGSLIGGVIVLISAFLLEWHGRRSRTLHEKIAANNAELRVQKIQLSDVVKAQYELATADLDPTRIMDLVLRHAQALTHAEGAVLELVEGNELLYHLATGVASEFIGLRISISGSLSGLCLESKKVLVCSDSETDPRANVVACRKMGIRSMIALPMYHREVAIGVLKVFSAETDHFGDEQATAITLIGGILSSSLGQARAFEEKQKAITALHTTEKKLIAAKNQAETATLAKSMLLANVSHEVRTPINGILGMASILIDTPLSAEQKDYARTILQSGESLLEIVNDILDLSKTDAGKLHLEEIDFDVLSTLQDLVRPFRVTAEKKSVEIELQVAERIPNYVKGDPGRLRQIIANLVSNAVKFTDSGKVSIRVSEGMSDPGRVHLRFEIQDSGVGINPQTIEKLFQPFAQGDVSTTRKYGGTGLGLSICKKLVQLMGGEIGVESTLKKGSTFWFEVNLRASEAAHLSRAQEEVEECLLFPPHTRILVAEDNPINQKVALKQLEKIGLQGHAVANGLEAIQALRTIPYHLVLMDCQMPEMDGYAASTLIKADADLRKVPIVAMTASAIQGERERCLAAGMDDYVTKPIKISTLQAVLVRWLMPEPTGAVLNPKVLEDLRSLDVPNGPSLISELGVLFLESLSGKLEELRKAANEGDSDRLSKIAHQMKSSAGNLGAFHFSHLFEQLEETTSAGKLMDLGMQIVRIERESEIVVKALHAEIASSSGQVAE
ncbi:MAG: CHASE3 domain-containing protein [Cryobacterium sp.]|nr:CHASE3 domain-containing protein [Oligoflexia bacterium]